MGRETSPFFMAFNIRRAFQALLQRNVKREIQQAIPKQVTRRELQRAQRYATDKFNKQQKRFANREFRILQNGQLTPTGTKVKQQMTQRKRFKYTKSFESFDSDEARREYIKRLYSTVDNSNEMWRENTIVAIQKVHGITATQDLVDYIQSLPINQFVEVMLTTDFNVAYVYTDAEKDTALEEIATYFGYE